MKAEINVAAVSCFQVHELRIDSVSGSGEVSGRIRGSRDILVGVNRRRQLGKIRRVDVIIAWIQPVQMVVPFVICQRVGKQGNRTVAARSVALSHRLNKYVGDGKSVVIAYLARDGRGSLQAKDKGGDGRSIFKDNWSAGATRFLLAVLFTNVAVLLYGKSVPAWRQIRKGELSFVVRSNHQNAIRPGQFESSAVKRCIFGVEYNAADAPEGRRSLEQYDGEQEDHSRNFRLKVREL